MRLWFAFKLYLWRIEKQPGAITGMQTASCDLLSNCIFDVLKNNKFDGRVEVIPVVICFQIVSLTYWKTTTNPAFMWMAELWFAFKLYLWRIEKQPHGLQVLIYNRCDLLSNCIFDVLKNNYSPNLTNPMRVVICFQIVSLTYWKTTMRVASPFNDALWFAFKLYLWRIEKQQNKSCYILSECCDLLSNCIFDVLKNNY